MKGIYNISLLILTVVLLAACSRKKNTFINRNFHALSTEYNTLYNGDVAFGDGKRQLAGDYRDNYWEILPIERIEVKAEEEKSGGETKSTQFNRAEEKAAKAIQKHSIYINGKEHNPQIDEAYMLLGKARYYDGRFIPAIDAFNFILDRYPTSNSINMAKVWRAKTNIRLRNEEVAIETLEKMFEQGELSSDEVADGAAMMSQAFINMDSIEPALHYIKIAANNVRDKELKGRYLYIKGQLYNDLGQKDSANIAFDEVIAMNRQTSRDYMINAYLEKAKNFDYEEEDQVAFLELLHDLEKDRENRPYLDKIYNQLGDYHMKTDSVDGGIAYYNKSIQAFNRDRVLQSINYQNLAVINFDRSAYRDAGAYYDSTLTFLEPNSRQWRIVTKKRENLEDVIKYEDIAAVNDSVLRIAAMSEAEQLAFFTEYTTKLKEKAIQDSIARVKNEQSIANQEFFKRGKAEAGPTKGGTFYFYNTTTTAFGKQEFRKRWGDRKLEDNWRLSTKQSSFGEDAIDDGSVVEEPIAESELYKPETYISQIPTDQVVLDSIAGDRNFAYYQLGLIYKEKFREYEIAGERLEKLLTFEPEERLIVPSKYNLFQIYDILEDSKNANKYKDDIISNHGDTRYAEILRNPQSQLPTDESSPEFKYKELYNEFENSKYAYVIAKADEYMRIYNGNDIVPKLELLKATAIGREQGFEAYKKALNFVSLSYPNSEEGKQAQEIYTKVLPIIGVKDFVPDTESESWKLVYQFDKDDVEAAEKLRDELDKALEDFNYFTMKTSIDYYDPETTFVIVHGLRTKMGAQGFGEVLKEDKRYKIKHIFFEISSPNYRIIQIHKNIEDYLNDNSAG